MSCSKDLKQSFSHAQRSSYLQEVTSETLEGETSEQALEETLDASQEVVDVEDVEKRGELVNAKVLGEDTTLGELGKKLVSEAGDSVVTLEDTTEETTSEALEETTAEKVAEDGLDIGEEAVDVEDVQETGDLLDVEALNDLGDLRSDLLGEAGDGVVTLDDTIDDRDVLKGRGDALKGVTTLENVDVGADTNVEELTLLLTSREALERLLNILELYNNLLAFRFA